ncbi:MAG: hypothetical protein AMXMBFR4_07250 [Candidatus Hydrogenedentota bacterium]
MHHAKEHRRILVIGIGNRFRRDDGVGPVVAELVRDRLESARQGKLSTEQEAPGPTAGPTDCKIVCNDVVSPAVSRHPLQSGTVQRMASRLPIREPRLGLAVSRGAALRGNLSGSITDMTLSGDMRNGLHEGFPGPCRIVEHSGEGASLMQTWRCDDAVILIDASSSGRAAGTVIEFDARTSETPSGLFRYSTHAFSVAEAIEMARTLDRLPRRLRVFAIEGLDFRMGTGLTPDVEQAARVVADRVMERIAELHSEGRSRSEPCTNSAS